MEFTPSELWSRILEALRPTTPEQSFQTWLAGSRGVVMGDDELVVEVAGPFHEEVIETRFRPAIEELAQRFVGRRVRLTLQSVAPDRLDDAPPLELTLPQDGPHPGPRPGAGSAAAGPDRAAPPSQASPQQANLNRRYTFDRFVVGNDNQLAVAACRAVAAKPARTYNPLFLYGGVGLGKTHLMHAIGNQILDAHPESRIVYVSSEQFMNELVGCIQNGQTSEFRRRYRAMDLLLVDDVHFLEGKERTQEEFFHTFNALYDAQRQIILTSDRPPKELAGLEERLVSRFAWGLVADIKAPDYETRVAILRKKAADDQITLDEEVIDYIARACTASVRELEGAVIKLLAHSSLTHQEMNVELARTALTGMLREDPDEVEAGPRVVPAGVKRMVAREWEVKPEALASKRRTKDLTVPRQVAMHLMKELLDLPLVQIGEEFGGRDHSTVIHSIRVVTKRMGEDPEFRGRVEELRRRLEDGG